MQTAMENLKEMVDVNTIVGDPVQTPDGNVILPISRVGFGFAAGGSQYKVQTKAAPGTAPRPAADDMPFGGGAGGGVSIQPTGFLVVGQSSVKLVSAEPGNQLYDKLIDLAPQVIDKIEAMANRSKHTETTIHPVS